MRQKLLVATPVSHIKDLLDKLKSHFDVTYLPDPDQSLVLSNIPEFDGIFVNPNKSRFRIDRHLIEAGKRLSSITTASTGTVHIDLPFAAQKGIAVFSLTREMETIEKISSTAELALTLTMAALRNLVPAVADALNGSWDYEKFVGRQVDQLTVGVVGYGRLGRKYAKYLNALGAKILVCDPYKKPSEVPFDLVTIQEIAKNSDVVALHVHVTPETTSLVNSDFLNLAKSSLVLVNTSRGEVVDEDAMVKFLDRNANAKIATDVLANEIDRKWESPLWAVAKQRPMQAIIAPHIGGMTHDAQFIAYHRAADLLIQSVTNK